MKNIANYLISHYKGTYRLKTPFDLNSKMFLREYTGQFADNDVYIDCYNKIQIFSYGHGTLEVYVPSLGRGHNIVKAIKSDLGDNIIFHIEETDSEVLFRFNAKDMGKLEKYLKPKTNGAGISPFSSKNLPKTKYAIPYDDLKRYKDVINKLSQNQLITLVHTTKYFITTLATKNKTLENIKTDMAIKGLKGKEYIHSIGKWDEYISYLKDNI